MSDKRGWRFDNTLQVQENADEMMAEVLECDKVVKPIAIYLGIDPNLKVKGKGYFIYSGEKGSIIEEIDIAGNAIAMNGRWYSLEEVRSTPWTQEDRVAYYAHRDAERKRTLDETAAFFKRKREMKKTRKEFLGF